MHHLSFKMQDKIPFENGCFLRRNPLGNSAIIQAQRPRVSRVLDAVIVVIKSIARYEEDLVSTQFGEGRSEQTATV